MVLVKNLVDKKCKKLEKDLNSNGHEFGTGAGGQGEKDKEDDDDEYVRMLVREELNPRLFDIEEKTKKLLREFQDKGDDDSEADNAAKLKEIQQTLEEHAK